MTDFLGFGEGDYARVRVDAITPPGVRPLDTVREELVRFWKGRELGERMRKIAEAAQKDVAAGKTFAQAAANQRIRVVSASETVTRRQATQGPAGEFGAALFGAKEGDVVSAPLQGGPILLVGQLHKIERDDPKANPGALVQMRQLMDQLLQQDMAQAFQTGAIERAKVKRNQAVIDRVLGVAPVEGAAAPK
jgi:peptidyl-prolyl cis-trans isomerase D